MADDGASAAACQASESDTASNRSTCGPPLLKEVEDDDDVTASYRPGWGRTPLP